MEVFQIHQRDWIGSRCKKACSPVKRGPKALALVIAAQADSVYIAASTVPGSHTNERTREEEKKTSERLKATAEFAVIAE